MSAESRVASASYDARRRSLAGSGVREGPELVHGARDGMKCTQTQQQSKPGLVFLSFNLVVIRA